VVDVANVMGARADGWWRDRAGAALRLCREVLALAARGTGPSGTGPSETGLSGTGPSETGLSGTGPSETGLSGTGPSESSGQSGERPAAAWVLVLEGRARDAAEQLRAAAPPGAGAPQGEALVPPTAASAAASAVPVRVVSAPASGDDAIVGVVAEVTGRAERCLVVTADRELRRRCEALGAAVVGPAWLLRLL
jgi:8-oxo-dGTP diphosphatase